MPDEQENSDTTADRAWTRVPTATLLAEPPSQPSLSTCTIDATAAQDIGSFIRAQREAAQVSMRQLASSAGVSNPYLSQIERGLRKPSAEVLAQIAKGSAVVLGGALRPGGISRAASPRSDP